MQTFKLHHAPVLAYPCPSAPQIDPATRLCDIDTWYSRGPRGLQGGQSVVQKSFLRRVFDVGHIPAQAGVQSPAESPGLLERALPGVEQVAHARPEGLIAEGVGVDVPAAVQPQHCRGEGRNRIWSSSP